MNNEPQSEHRWLAKLVGEWEGKGEAEGPAGEGTSTWRSRQSVRAIGELWIQCEASNEMDDGSSPSTMLITLGYDPAQGRYVGNFVGSMMSSQWIYSGSVDAGGRSLTLDTRGPDWSTGELRDYQDIIDIVDDNEHVLRSRMLGDDGQWQQIMQVRYRRVS
ncbi:DUF1579 domain-containing protein [Lysobacter silvisoli]|uniref:DUF1579 domain-containing protein n=1 Tax=Lysobacter silvisoli TaxID=2293254 RepID=A0A371K2X9_9GAMM|nr:DUF1579 domain-containing protein [Lysobacter silvisoli]RDZ28207.1 DUF1579 domain-containing protein [Lysobacter silvisoli]